MGAELLGSEELLSKDQLVSMGGGAVVQRELLIRRGVARQVGGTKQED